MNLKFENAALFQALGLPSTLLRHKNGAFSKTLFKPEEFENPPLFVLKTGLFENDNHVISPIKFSQT